MLTSTVVTPRRLSYFNSWRFPVSPIVNLEVDHGSLCSLGPGGRCSCLSQRQFFVLFHVLIPVFVSMWRSGDRRCLKYLQVRDSQCVKTMPNQVRITSWQKSLANSDYHIPPLISCPCKFQHIQIYANVFEYVRLSEPQTG